MTLRLTEDDLYRTSTQFRLWSFAPEQLAAQRQKTHDLAIQRAQQHATTDARSLEFLTLDEEVRLVQKYCDTIRATSAAHLKWPSNVTATAIQYLKRFYLTNSCMTYPPKEIYKTALFLASKTEAIHCTLSKYAKSISADPDAVLAPEYKLMQALRFTLDVRHPFRGLKGVLMELLNMAAGEISSADGATTMNGKEVQQRLQTLPAPPKECATPWEGGKAGTVEEVGDRIQAAFVAARSILENAANLTDAYFLYTPSQMMLAAMHLADSTLTTLYFDTKLPLQLAVRPKIIATIHSCAELLAAFSPTSIMSKDERAELDKKLELCRDPATKDLIKSHAAMKRNGAENGSAEDQEIKRRKLERQKSSKEMDDLFGPSLKPSG